MKIVDAFDHVLAAHDPTALEACRETFLTALDLSCALHVQDMYVIWDEGAQNKVTYLVSVEGRVLLVK